MEAEKVADATPDENAQAGDPFTTTEAPSGPVTGDTTTEDQALKALDALDVPGPEPESEPKPEPRKTVEETQAIVNAASERVKDAERALADAHRRYRLACQLQAENRPALTLAEMNKIQSRVTGTETRRRARAMKALGELGFGEPTRKNHPPLFQPGPPPFEGKG